MYTNRDREIDALAAKRGGPLIQDVNINLSFGYYHLSYFGSAQQLVTSLDQAWHFTPSHLLHVTVFFMFFFNAGVLVTCRRYDHVSH